MNHECLYGAGMWGFFPMFGLIFFVIFLLFAASCIFGRRCFKRPGGHFGWHPHDGGETPLDILKKRYAKGEISKEDFDRMKKDIQE